MGEGKLPRKTTRFSPSIFSVKYKTWHQAEDLPTSALLFIAPATFMWPGISIILHPEDFVKRKIVQKSNKFSSRICATLPIDFWGDLWYINNVKREVPTRDTKMGDEVHRVKKVRKKKNSLLTNPLKCDTIRVQKKRATHHRALAVAQMNNGRWETHESYIRPSSKNLKKVLDKIKNLCYNKGTKRKGNNDYD